VRDLAALVRLGRPKFLVGGVVFYVLGAAVAWRGGAVVDAAAFAWGQLVVTAAQLLTHYSNDYFDRDSDRVNTVRTPWSGGSGVIPAGQLLPKTALIAGLVAGAVAAAGLLALAAQGATPLTLGVLTAGVALAWSYSSPPLRLHSTGLGEIVGATLLAGLTPFAGYLVQSGAQPENIVGVTAPMIALQFGMLVTVSLPDITADRLAGKRTLGVRMGRAGASYAAVASYVAAVPLASLAARDGTGPPLWFYTAWLPLFAWQLTRLLGLARGREPSWWSLGFGSVALVVGPAVTVLAWLMIRVRVGSGAY
jgi:1,4-dihydroxy-2-naphthoate polyprenyltransferase